MNYGPGEFTRDLGFHVPRETIERLETHRRLLADWSGRMNLVGPKELEAFWQRHALDSAQLVALAPQAKRWVDLGSGAGFPGLVVAAFQAVLGAIVLALAALDPPIIIPGAVVAGTVVAFGAVLAVIANSPPTLNPGDTFKTVTPQGTPNYVTTVATPPAADAPPVPTP
jgi:hypothetical protein